MKWLVTGEKDSRKKTTCDVRGGALKIPILRVTYFLNDPQERFIYV